MLERTPFESRLSPIETVKLDAKLIQLQIHPENMQFVYWSRLIRASGSAVAPHVYLTDKTMDYMKSGYWNWNSALIGACRGGYRELIDLCVANGADDWNGALEAACRCGHRELIDFCVANGATNWGGAFWCARTDAIKRHIIAYRDRLV